MYVVFHRAEPYSITMIRIFIVVHFVGLAGWLTDFHHPIYAEHTMPFSHNGIGSVEIVLRTNISAYIGHHANNLIFNGKNKTRRDVDAAIKEGWSATHLSGFKIAAGTSITIFVVEPILGIYGCFRKTLETSSLGNMLGARNVSPSKRGTYLTRL